MITNKMKTNIIINISLLFPYLENSNSRVIGQNTVLQFGQFG